MQPLPYNRNSPEPRRRHLGGLALFLFLTSVALFFVFRCSGLHLPMWNPTASLNDRLSRDMNLSLPATAKVTHGVREAYSDPAEYYVIELPAADAAAFIAQLQAIATIPLNPDPAQATNRIPDWWTPRRLPNMQALEYRQGQSTYRWFYSNAGGTIYLVWLDY